MSILDLTSTQLRQAADLKDKIEALNLELEQFAGKTGAVAVVPVADSVAPKKRGRPRKEVAGVVVQPLRETPKRGPKKGGMSAEGRARIAEAQRARWAKVNAAKTESPKAEKPTKRKMSAAGRAAIIAAQKLRWSKVKGTTTAAKSEPKTGKRTMSAAAKLAISKAAKARWAKVRAAKKG